MGDHIIPQVLLRGFSINPDVSKRKQKIMYYNGKEVKTGKIHTLYQRENYYSRDVETELDKKYEQPFGIIKKNMMSILYQSNNGEYEMTKNDYYTLIKFFVIMWRRNDVQMKKLEDINTSILQNPNIRKLMRRELQSLSPKKIFDNHEKELREALYRNAILNTTSFDPTVVKSIQDYYPLIIVNKTKINFPLHSKYASVVQYTSKDIEYPDFTIEPITNKIFVILRKKKRHGLFDGDKINIPVAYVSDEKLIEGIIQLYLLDDADSIILDESNKEIITNRMKDFDNNRLNTTTYQGRATLDLIFERI